MKKFLSIFLAVTMILAMVPTTFATADTEAGYTYIFSRDAFGSEKDISKGDLGEKKLSDILLDKSAPWRAAGQRYILNAMSDENGFYFYSGIGRATGAGNIGIELNVGMAGTYTPSITYTAKDSAPIVDVYLVKEGTSVTVNSTTYTTDDIKGLDSKNGDITIYHFTDKLPEKKLGQINMYSAKEEKLTKTFATQELDKNSKYYLLFRVVGLDDEHAPMVLEETEYFEVTVKSFELKLEKLDKTHEYTFNRSVLAEDNENNKVLAEAGYKVFYAPEGDDYCNGNYLDSYDNIDKTLTDEWCVSLLGGSVGKPNSSSYRKWLSTLSNSGLNMVTRRDMANSENATARFVLKLKVLYDGIYNITAEVGELSYGTDANVYMIKADTVEKITPDVLKKHKIIGRVGNVTGRTDGDVGATELIAGDWYMIFDFNTTNPTQNSGQTLCLEKLTFTELDAMPESGATPEPVVGDNIPKISFSATTNIPDIAKVTINGNEGNLAILNPSRGAELSVSAPEVSGYKFIGWKSGAANEKGDGELANTAKFVKGLEQNGTFTVYTSTFLTAVYEELTPADDAAQRVEFWNLDGSYLGQKTVDKIEEEGGLPTTSLIGHTFTGWFTAEDVALDLDQIVEKVTHAVAGYTSNETLEASNYDCVRVNGVQNTDAKAYGYEVLCEDSGEGTVTHWLRDGNVVSYNPTYKYYAWDTTNISSSYAAIEKKPLVVLDSDTVSDAYMIEYDKGDAASIVEVGILFGTGKPTVESKSEIFKSQRGDDHGQFAAKPTNSTHTARGYMIYKDTDNSYKVIYSD